MGKKITDIDELSYLQSRRKNIPPTFSYFTGSRKKLFFQAN